MLLSDYLLDVRNLVHDPNSSDFSDTTLTGFINQGRRRVALDCSVGQNTFIAGLNTIPLQETYPLTGWIGGYTVNAGGFNYSANPTIAVAGGGGTLATASAVVAGGVIIGINATNWGKNYATVPTITITDPTGTGASATAILGTSILNVKLISVLWGNLRITFDYLSFQNFQTFARAYTQLFSRPGCYSVHKNNQTVYTYPIADAVYPMEWEVVQYPTPLVTSTDVDNQIVDPWNDAVKFYAAGAAIASLQQYEKADYWWGDDPRKPGKYQLRVRQLPAGVTPYRIFNPYMLGRSRVRRL